MHRKSVAVVKCKDYESDGVDAAVKRAFDLIGGIERYVKPGMKVLLKVNLLRKSRPEQCVTTHPGIVRAVCNKVIEAGATPVICDSPGGAYNASTLISIYESTGMAKAAKQKGTELNWDFSHVRVQNKKANKLKSFDVISPVLDADLIINMPKLKTHTFTKFSGAIKNLYGAVPGLTKVEYHFLYQSMSDFSDMLIDIAEFVKPALTVMDAVVGMEGDGPGNGDPRHIGAIIASENMYLVDAAAVQMMGLLKKDVPVLSAALERGLLDEDMNVLGDDLSDFILSDFNIPDCIDGSVLRKYLPEFLSTPLENLLAIRPNVMPDKCVGCAICAGVCPAKALEIKNGCAHIDKKKCIRCFCCMEFCPKKAIEGRRSSLIRMAAKVIGDHK